jgi:multimeric flavodoxin WrbA
MADVLAKLKVADVWILASPLYWDGLTGQMKNLLDRLLPLIKPEISIMNGHCRHELIEGVSGGKVVLISTCGFWEPDNFEPMVNHIKAATKNIHREFAGALLRPHGALIKYWLNSNNRIKDVLSAVKTAGFDLVKDGGMSEEILSKISSELLPRDEYIKEINSGFHRSTNKK